MDFTIEVTVHALGLGLFTFTALSAGTLVRAAMAQREYRLAGFCGTMGLVAVLGIVYLLTSGVDLAL